MESPRHGVGEALHGRLAALRVLHEAHDLRQRARLARVRGAHQQRAVLVHAAAYYQRVCVECSI